jgi:hypothetical protein
LVDAARCLKTTGIGMMPGGKSDMVSTFLVWIESLEQVPELADKGAIDEVSRRSAI